MDRQRNKTKRLTACALLCALGVILLGLGALIEVLDLSMAALASVLVVFAVIELGGAYPYLIYGVTAILSVFLLPSKAPALIYLLFAGYYPILKAQLEKHFKKVTAMILKLIIFNAGLSLAIFLLFRFFAPSADILFRWRYWLLLFATPVFLLYDLALTRLITFYCLKLRDRFRFLQK